MSIPEPDILRRGQAIFDRLREETADQPTAAADEVAEEGASPAPGSEQSEHAGETPAETAGEVAVDPELGSAIPEPLAEAALSAADEPIPVPDPPTVSEIVEEAVANLPVAEPTPETTEAPAPPQVEGRKPHPASLRSLPRVVAVANQKGGVGKTTTAVNLGAGLAELGFRVLIIDLDPQGNATTGLGINQRNLEHSVYDVLLHDVALDDCIEPTAVRNLFVAPATIDLAGADIELVPAFSRELRLRRAIESLDDSFDFTIIDCPPSLGLITVNGLAAANEVIVPIQCEYYALEGLGQLLKNVNLVSGNLNPQLEVSAIVLTMYDSRTKLADQVAQEVRNHFGERVCRMVIPRTVRLSEAPSFGQPILTFDPTSRGAVAYRELAKEVSGRVTSHVTS
ncbi:MAG TPA: AAA family ATPase [Acidimicrobiales bacterium]|nr:AAA family ATPase [Acidimicrobiales bacterium]